MRRKKPSITAQTHDESCMRTALKQMARYLRLFYWGFKRLSSISDLIGPCLLPTPARHLGSELPNCEELTSALLTNSSLVGL